MAKLKFKVRSSRIQGRGAFATQKIRKGTRIIEYQGELITQKEADERYEDTDDTTSPILLFQVDKRHVIDAGVNGNEARFINHSCDPNCETVGDKRQIFVEAIRTIYPGEELTYDYSLTRDELDSKQVDKDYVCHCGAANCRGSMLEPLPKKRKKAVKRGTKKRAGKKRR
jgi:SET domain-containing protein